MPPTRLRTERGFDRLVNYSDAVVAIAITLLVLPLVDLGGELAGGDALGFVGDHLLQFEAFLVTFMVTTIFWVRHHAMFELMRGYDPGLLWLNSFWLLFIVLFPFTSELINTSGFANGAGVLYCLNMAALSVLQGLIVLHVRARPALWAPDVTRVNFRPGWSWVYAGYFVFVALLSVPLPDVAAWSMLGLVLLGHLKDRMTQE